MNHFFGGVHGGGKTIGLFFSLFFSKQSFWFICFFSPFFFFPGLKKNYIKEKKRVGFFFCSSFLQLKVVTVSTHQDSKHTTQALRRHAYQTSRPIINTCVIVSRTWVCPCLSQNQTLDVPFPKVHQEGMHIVLSYEYHHQASCPRLPTTFLSSAKVQPRSRHQRVRTTLFLNVVTFFSLTHILLCRLEAMGLDRSFLETCFE